MAEPSNPPAPGTPPANDPAPGGNVPPAPTPTPQPGNTPPAQEFILTQEQFNQRFAEKMGAIEKELGLSPGGLKDFVAAQKKAKTPAPPMGDVLSGADLKLARMEALMTAGVPSKQIPLLLQHLNISGKTREEIAASVQGLIELKLLTVEAPAQPGTNTPPGQTGTGSNPANPPSDPKTKRWKKSEIQSILKDPSKADATVLEEINKAQREGRVDYSL